MSLSLKENVRKMDLIKILIIKMFAQLFCLLVLIMAVCLSIYVWGYNR